MLAALTGAGFTEVSFRGRTGGEHRFDAAERERCPCCQKEHTSNKWWAKEDGSRYIVGNYSTECQKIRIDCTGRRIAPAANGDFLSQLPGLAEDGGWDPASVKPGDSQEMHRYIVPVTRWAPLSPLSEPG